MIVVDEICSSEDVQAVKTIAQHGVTVIATAPGNSLRSLIGNPMNVLVGGTRQVVFADKQDK